MIDEEMAEKYAKGLCKTCKVDVCRYSGIQTCVTKESLKQAYLAGLKAGRLNDPRCRRSKLCLRKKQKKLRKKQ